MGDWEPLAYHPQKGCYADLHDHLFGGCACFLAWDLQARHMNDILSSLMERCHKLGLRCDEFPTGHLSSTLAALSCFPMYMVANVHGWTSDRQFHIPLLDLPGSEHIREAFEIGKQEGDFEMTKEHRRVLGSLLSQAKAPDLVIYEYALETVKAVLPQLSPALAEQVRTAIARMVVAVAQASGEGFLGTGEKISPEERACIGHIDRELSLAASPRAAEILKAVG